MNAVENQKQPSELDDIIDIFTRNAEGSITRQLLSELGYKAYDARQFDGTFKRLVELRLVKEVDLLKGFAQSPNQYQLTDQSRDRAINLFRIFRGIELPPEQKFAMTRIRHVGHDYLRVTVTTDIDGKEEGLHSDLHLISDWIEPIPQPE